MEVQGMWKLLYLDEFNLSAIKFSFHFDKAANVLCHLNEASQVITPDSSQQF